MKLFDLLSIQYNKFITATKDYLSGVLKKNGESIELNDSSVFGQFINVLSSAMKNIMLYIEDSLVEQNKYTATRKKSIYSLASISGHRINPGKAAMCNVKLHYIPNNVDDFRVILPNHQPVICAQNGLYYNFILPQSNIILSTDNNSTRDLLVVQGKFESQSHISTGGKLYSTHINYVSHLDIDYISVKVNGKLWEKRDCLYDMEPDAEQYYVVVGFDNGFDIIFGTGRYGKMLIDGDNIDIEYLLHDGSQGNLDADVAPEFIFEADLADISGEPVNGNNVFKIMGDIGGMYGGTDAESTNQVREMIGSSSRSRVLTDASHYKEFISQYSYCGYNKTWTERGSLIVKSLILKNFKSKIINTTDYYNLTDNDFILSEQQKKSIYNSVISSGRTLAGTDYYIIDPVLRKYALQLHIRIGNNVDKVHTTNKIRTLIAKQFMSLSQDYYISKSEIIYNIKSQIPDIDAIDIYIISQANEDAKRKGYYVENNMRQRVYPGENPGIGLDDFGNIKCDGDMTYPVLMGGWSYINTEEQQVFINNPVTIHYTTSC